jgi:branched-chain amino acid transport system permease protein
MSYRFRPAPGDGEFELELGWEGWRLIRGSRSFSEIVMVVVGGGALVSMLAVVWLPALEGRLVSQFVAISVALLGLQFSVGVAGQLSLCHGVFVGIGSYASAIAIGRFGLPPIAGLVIAPIVGFLAGCLVGTLALRIKATYLGPVTLSVAVAFPMLVKRFSWFTGGSSGLPVVRTIRPPSFLGLHANRVYVWNHAVIVAVAVIAVVAARNVVTSPVGLSVRAMAENPLAAEASGVNLWRTRLLSYGWGAAFGALGGALLVIVTPVVGADSYDLFRSLGYYAAVMVGGVTSMAGAALGAAVLVAVPWLIDKNSWSASPNLVLGALLVASTLIAPGGLVVLVRRAIGRIVRVEETGPGIIPSEARRRPRTGRTRGVP